MNFNYAEYIVPAFAISALIFAWMIADTLLRARKWRREAERLLAEKAEREG